MGLEFGTAAPGDAPESLECPLRLRAPEDTFLKPNTTYTVQAVGGNLGTTSDNDEDTGAATGWSIENALDWVDASDDWQTHSGGFSLRIAINGENAVNTPATGSIAISGRARVGGTLTGMANNLADVNGLPENATDPKREAPRGRLGRPRRVRSIV